MATMESDGEIFKHSYFSKVTDYNSFFQATVALEQSIARFARVVTRDRTKTHEELDRRIMKSEKDLLEIIGGAREDQAELATNVDEMVADLNTKIKNVEEIAAKCFNDLTQMIEEHDTNAETKINQKAAEIGELRNEMVEQIASLKEQIQTLEEKVQQLTPVNVPSLADELKATELEEEPEYLDDAFAYGGYDKIEHLQQHLSSIRGNVQSSPLDLISKKLDEMKTGFTVKVKKRETTPQAEMNMFSPGDNRSKITTFDGSPRESFSSWIKRLKLTLLSEPFPPNNDQKLAFLLLHLDGKAERVYKSMSDDDKEDFEKVVAHLQSKFPADGVKKHAESQLVKCYQEINETVHQFSNRLSKIVNLILQDESQDFVDKYLQREMLGRLKPELQIKVRQEDPDSYEKVIKLATKFEDYENAKKQLKKSKAKNSNNESLENLMAQNMQISGETRTCFNCHSTGHIQINCPRPVRPRSRSDNYRSRQQNRTQYPQRNFQNRSQSVAPGPRWTQPPQRNWNNNQFNRANSPGFQQKGGYDYGQRVPFHPHKYESDYRPSPPQSYQQKKLSKPVKVKFAEAHLVETEKEEDDDFGGDDDDFDLTPTDYSADLNIFEAKRKHPRITFEDTDSKNYQKDSAESIKLYYKNSTDTVTTAETTEKPKFQSKADKIMEEIIDDDDDYLLDDYETDDLSYPKLLSDLDAQADKLLESDDEPIQITESVKAGESKDDVTLHHKLSKGQQKLIKCSQSSKIIRKRIESPQTDKADNSRKAKLTPTALLRKRAKDKIRRQKQKERKLADKFNELTLSTWKPSFRKSVIGKVIGNFTPLMLAVMVICQLMYGGLAFTTPMICDESATRTLLYLPQRTHLADNILPQTPPIRVSYEVYRENTIPYSTEAHLCQCFNITSVYSQNWHGKENIELAKLPIKVTVPECQKMITVKSSFAGALTNFDDFLGTNNSIVFEKQRWPLPFIFPETVQTQNCYLSNLIIHARHNKAEIQQPVKSNQPCYYGAGVCDLKEKGVLKWDPDVNQKCDYIPLSTINGTFSDNIFINDAKDMALTFHDAKVIQDCNRTLVISQQGYGIQDKALNQTKHEAHQNYLRQKKEHRQKRDTGLTYSTQASTNHAALELSTTDLFRTTYKLIASMFDDFLNNIMSLAEANPTELARQLLNSSNVIARMVTPQIMEVQTCSEVPFSAIHFAPIRGTCFSTLPVKFSHFGYELQGFMNHKNMVIEQNSNQINCDNDLPIYIQMAEDKLVRFDQADPHERIIDAPGEIQMFHKITLPALQPGTHFHNLILANLSEVLAFENYYHSATHAQVINNLIKDLDMPDLVNPGKETALKFAERTVANGLFPLFNGLVPSPPQIWIFLVCLYVTITVLLRLFMPSAYLQFINHLNVFSLFQQVQTKWRKPRISRHASVKSEQQQIQTSKIIDEIELMPTQHTTKIENPTEIREHITPQQPMASSTIIEIPELPGDPTITRKKKSTHAIYLFSFLVISWVTFVRCVTAVRLFTHTFYNPTLLLLIIIFHIKMSFYAHR